MRFEPGACGIQSKRTSLDRDGGHHCSECVPLRWTVAGLNSGTSKCRVAALSYIH
jgi:hypothetical protein